MHTTSRTLIAIAVSALLGACAGVAPTAPAAAPPAQFKESAGSAAGQAALPVPDSWWQLFNDPVLNDLEQRVVVGNENLKLTLAQLAAARAILGGSERANQPTLSASLGGTRSANASTVNSSTTDPTNSVSLLATAGWEVDLWGRLSLATQSAQAGVQASQADLAAAQLSAQATLAQTYFALRSAEVQQSLLLRSLAAYQQALDLTLARYGGGVAPRTDVLQAQTQLNATQTQVADVAAQRAQLEHAIAVLLGMAPSSLTIAPTAQLPATVTIPASLPADLLERRPDIAAAELRVKAAYAQIGVADANLFPTLSLSASAGYSQSSLANLISAPNLLWSIGASVTQSIFDAGVHQQASEQARATADQTTASYRQLVLGALQEVEDNLVLANRLAEEVQSQTQALESSRRTLEITLEQYRAGTVGYLNVSSAQSTALASEITLLAVRTRLLNATNILLKNVGGRWDLAAAK